MQQTNQLEVKIAIVGAGVSGLKAAHTLLNHDCSKLTSNDIVIVEAQDRIGGRILTDHTSSKFGNSYDLGAAWFHDTLTNKVLQEAIEDNDKSSFDFHKDGYYDDKDVRIYSSDQDGAIDVNHLKLHRVVEDLEKFIELYFFGELGTSDMSLREIIGVFLEKYDKILTKEQKLYCGRILRYLELWYGITWDKISAKYSIMDHQGRNLYNKKGYDFLINKLLRGISSERIILNEPIRNINRDNKTYNKSILIESVNGLKIYSDYLIVTVPQSILALDKSSPEGINWNPSLPNSITNALKTIHFGALGKVIFEFDSIWWDKDEDRFEILADNFMDDEPSQPLNELPKPFTYPAFIVNYAAIHKESLENGGSLCILTQSPLTGYLESHPDEAWTYFKPMLEKLVIKGKSITDPINTITSKWTTNPYIRGSYAAVHNKDDPSGLIIQLCGEYNNCGLSDTKIRFAGEHTISDAAGCVHGAYQSGEREAIWILKDLGYI